MQKIDQALRTWAVSAGIVPSAVAPTFEALETMVGRPSDWNSDGGLDDLPHVLEDYSHDLGTPIPDRFIAYRLGKWAGKPVDPSHPLVKDHQRWQDAAHALVAGVPQSTDTSRLAALAAPFAKGEARQRLRNVAELVACS